MGPVGSRERRPNRYTSPVVKVSCQLERARLLFEKLWMPTLLGLVTVGLCLGRLLDPDVVPAFRDLPFFHLPLRTTFATTPGQLFPTWNSGIHGGQPILSNPNYAAFYPPTWLAFLVAPFRAISWLLFLHGLLAYAGAWRLLARLGAGTSACALGAVAYFAGGAFLASTNTLNLYTAMALFPWVVAAGIETLEKDRDWLRNAAWTGLGLGLQLLAGAPEAVLISALTLLALTSESSRGRWRRLAAVAGLATLVGAIQLFPTLDRVASSARGRGLSSEEALAWSFPPPRIAEMAYPRFFGDTTRQVENLYFGWGIHDQDYPYVVSIYPGLLVLCVGLATLLAFPVPYRRAWSLAAGLGFLLALGRHNPLYLGSLEFLPWLGAIRYPEKFVLLSTSCLAIAGALGWDHLLKSRGTSSRPSPGSRLPVGIALLVLCGAALLSALLHLYPQSVANFVTAHRDSPSSLPLLGEVLTFLRDQAWISMSIAASTALLLSALRRPRISSRLLGILALLLLTGDLFFFAQGTTPVLDASEILRPPAGGSEIQGEGSRVFSPSFLSTRSRLHLRHQEKGTVPIRSRLERFAPYVANLWGFQYVVHGDFDRMATRWARHTGTAYEEVAEDDELAERFLGAWDVGYLVDARPIEDLLREKLEGRKPESASSRVNSHRQNRFRIPLRARFHSDPEEALAAARRSRFAVGSEEHLIGGRRSSPSTLPPGEILESHAEGGHIDVRYRSEGESLLVLAVTFDEGWQGFVGEGRVELYPTALGQIAAAIPAGDQTLELRYRQRGLLAGATASLIGLVLVGLAVRKEGRATSGRMPR